jgi:Holliday junction resolvase-like predicted endonuclease
MPIWGLEQALNRRKQGRIIRTSLRFIDEHPRYHTLQPRYDVLFVQESVTHIRDAFSGSGVW